MEGRKTEGTGSVERRLLVVGRDRVELDFLKSSLEARGYRVVVTALGERVWEALEALKPQLIAIDVQAGLVDPLDDVLRIKEMAPDDAFIPVLAIFPSRVPAQIVRGFHLGVDDFLVRPFELFELVLRLEVLWRIKRLQDEVLATNCRLRELSISDDLTGLCNQTEFKRRMSLELKRVDRFGLPLSVIFFDIDHFKNVNDTHGHAVGSHVIREIANILIVCLRETDALGRYGGDEYVIGLPGCGLDDAVDVAERLRCLVAETLFRLGQAEVYTTLSMGVAEFSPGDDLEALLGRADMAMYVSKQSGRNCVNVLRPRDALPIMSGSDRWSVPIASASESSTGDRTVRRAIAAAFASPRAAREADSDAASTPAPEGADVLPSTRSV